MNQSTGYCEIIIIGYDTLGLATKKFNERHQSDD